MEGRWTISYEPAKTGLFGHLPALRRIEGPATDEVPVVPCDDAAIGRAAEALWDLIPCGWPVEKFRVAAEAAFRAAGETP